MALRQHHQPIQNGEKNCTFFNFYFQKIKIFSEQLLNQPIHTHTHTYEQTWHQRIKKCTKTIRNQNVHKRIRFFSLSSVLRNLFLHKNYRIVYFTHEKKNCI
jgi:hypothetical protein